MHRTTRMMSKYWFPMRENVKICTTRVLDRVVNIFTEYSKETNHRLAKFKRIC